MADAPLCFVAHPCTIVANVFRQTAGTRPFPFQIQIFRLRPLVALQKAHRWPARELRRDLDHCLVDKHGHGVQVTSESLESQPLRLKWDGSATGKRIVQRRQPVGIEQLGGLRVVIVQLTNLPP